MKKNLLAFTLVSMLLFSSFNVAYADSTASSDSIFISDGPIEEDTENIITDVVESDEAANINYITNIVPYSDRIAYPVEGGNIYYSEYNKRICDADKTITNAVIPAEINGMKISGIGYRAFLQCTELRSIEIPESITIIDEQAFANCSSLTSIKLPNSITQLGRGAFSGCKSLTNIELPDTIKTIYYNTFNECSSLKNINIPNGITKIESYAFRRCTNLTNITLPKSLIDIGTNIFDDCPSITTIDVDKDNQIYYSADGALLSKAEGKTTLIAIPRTLKQYTISEGVQFIASGAFSDCMNLSSVTIPKTVESIELPLFSDCISLDLIDVDNSNPFYCSVNGALYNKDMTTIVVTPKIINEFIIPQSVTSIDIGAFMDCNNLKNVELPDSVTYIGEAAFNDCHDLTSIKIPDGVTSIEPDLFSECYNLTNIKMPKYLTTIKDNAFYNCRALKSIAIPETVTAIGPYAFYGCRSLIGIEIPNGVTTIEEGTFAACTCLASIIIPESITEIRDGFIAYYDPDKITFYVKEGSYADEYLKSSGKNFKISYDSPPTTTTEADTETTTNDVEVSTVAYNVGDGNIYFDKTAGIIIGADVSVANINIPSRIDEIEVNAIGDHAFSTCSNLTDITIPQSVTSISKSAFEGCPALAIHCYKGSCADDMALYPEGSTITYLDETVQKGDVNGDDIVDSRDSLILFKYIAGDNIVNLDESLVDFNNDGIIDSRDSLILFKYVAGDNVALQ